MAQPLRQLGEPLRDRVPDALPEAVGCNASGQCLVVWMQRAEGVQQVVESTQGTVLVLLAQRFDASGPVDARPSPLANGISLEDARVGVGPAGEFLVAWAKDYQVFAQRIAADGSGPVDAEPVALTSAGNALENYRPVEVVHAEGTYAVFLEDDEGLLGLARLRAGQLLAEPARDEFYIWQGQVARGPGTEVGMVNGRTFRRLDVATGSFLDHADISFSQRREGQSAGLTYNGTDYVVAWPASDGKIYANLIGRNGDVSEPGDDLVPAGHVVGEGASIPYPLKLFFDGTHSVAFYQYTHPGPLGSLALDEQGARANGNVASAWDQVVVDGRVGADQTTFLSEHAGFVSYRAQPIAQEEDARATGRFLTASASGKPAVGAPRQLGTQTRGQLASASASNGRDFLVAYRDSAADVHVRVVDGGTGKPVGAATSAGAYPTNSYDALTLIWTGKVYLLQVGEAFRVVSCDGTRVGPERHFPGNASVACNGEVCALAYDTGTQLVVGRVDAANGHLLDTLQPVATTGFGSFFAVAANTSPAAEERTFLVAWSTPLATVRGSFVSAASGAVTASQELMKTPFALGAVSVATDGNDFMVSNRDLAVVVSAELQSTVSGAQTLSGRLLWHDGARYAGLRNEYLDRIYFLAPDGARELMEQEDFDAQPLAVLESAAGTRFGRSLVTEHRFDSAEQAYVIAGRLLDSEGTAALPQRPDSPCNFTGDGGASGEGAGGSSGAGGENVEGGEGGIAPTPHGGTTSAGTAGTAGTSMQPSEPSSEGQAGAATDLPAAGTNSGGRAPGVDSAGKASAPEPGGAAGANDAQSPAPPNPADGCGCSVPTDSNHAGLSLVATALLVLLQRRRRGSR